MRFVGDNSNKGGVDKGSNSTRGLLETTPTKAEKSIKMTMFVTDSANKSGKTVFLAEF